ncbi:M20/M25/M40 family metallo-hydrolase [Thermaerobacter sp. FW80]|uniref:M28 family metallopeptidase n=1 Tax=Thermaerobacter sp. FW80 TaxID=2546351 RepID=UPI00107525C2|nr:M20/M25/M40 family metallo-hydrolase [Thermaerobacter sp. FW80]QBS37430.1 M20/M25/M40 family metallo-hydrolase [Thermaerobacter sp. FW80]
MRAPRAGGDSGQPGPWDRGHSDVPDPWDDLVALCRLPHRGTATAEEGRAARWLAARLAEMGYQVDVQPFTAPRHTLYLGPGFIGVALAALGIGGARWQGPAWALGLLAAAAALVLLPLLGELVLWPRGSRLSLALLVPRGASQNVVARLPRRGGPAAGAARGAVGGGAPHPAPRPVREPAARPPADVADPSATRPPAAAAGPNVTRPPADAAGAAAARPPADAVEPGAARPPAGPPWPLHVVVTAHYDTQWGSWLFAPRILPGLQAFFVVGYAAFLAVPLLLVARAVGLAGSTPLAVAAAASAAVAAFLLISWLGGRPVNGANDNGSGVAVALALARRWARQPLPGIELLLAFTGAEETGMRGMAALLEHPWFPRTAPGGVAVVNVDNVGAGRLHYLTAEGMLLPVRYDPWLVAQARRLAEELPAGLLTPGPRPLLPTDALVAAARGIPAITFLATGPGGRIPHYHWHTDRLEHVDRGHLAGVADLLWRYLAQLATAADRAAGRR